MSKAIYNRNIITKIKAILIPRIKYSINIFKKIINANNKRYIPGKVKNKTIIKIMHINKKIIAKQIDKNFI